MSACCGVGRSFVVAEEEVVVALAQVFLEQGEVAAGGLQAVVIGVDNVM